LEKDILILEQEVVKEIPLTALKKKIEEGDYVRIKTGGAIGKLLSLGKEKALVEMGGMTLTVKAKDLVSADVPIEQNRRPGVTTTLRSDQEPESKVDLRGMRKEEAVKVLESFIDNALIHNAHMLRILHGKGDGVLKKLVWTKLKEYKDVREVQHPEEEFGGSGVTIVKL
ncbi:MAG: Smr/MutS family protein, partial [Saprospiraceae bacterium]|nr:Smr/MutS family protein [Saprospiraceae bacterium]